MAVFSELLAFDTPVFYPQHKSEAGPAFWGTLHNVASMYEPSPAAKKEMRTFLKRWLKGFPCSKCQRHGRDYIRENKPDLKSRERFLQWTEDFHNWVNENLNKEKYAIEFDKHRKCPDCNVKVPRSKYPSVPPLPYRGRIMEDYAYAMDTANDGINSERDSEVHMSGMHDHRMREDDAERVVPSLLSADDTEDDAENRQETAEWLGGSDDESEGEGQALPVGGVQEDGHRRSPHLSAVGTSRTGAGGEVYDSLLQKTPQVMAPDAGGLGSEDNAGIDATGTEGHFDSIRDAYEDIMYELCDASGIPREKIRMHFHTCPDIPDKSCTKAVVGDRGLSEDGYIDVFFDPMSASPRSVVHEFYHVHKAFKGDIEAFKDENAAEAMARPIIEKHFPYDPVTAKDTTVGTALLSAEDTMQMGSYFPYQPRMSETLMSRYRREPEAKKSAGDEVVLAGDGFASVFDRIVPDDIAKVAGLPASVIADAAAPEIVGYTTNALQDLVLSPFGVAVTSVLGGVGLFGASIAMGDSLPFRDRKLLFEYGNHMFWSFIRYANPGSNQQLYAGANAAGQALVRLDLGGVASALLKGSAAAAAVAKPAQQVQGTPPKQVPNPPVQSPESTVTTNFAIGGEDGSADINSTPGIYSNYQPSGEATRFAVPED